jgi:hypothetical protein
MGAIRIVQPEEARGCTFLGSVTATEIPRLGLLREGTPAIVLLQREAATRNADALEITHSEQQYDERWSARYGGRARTLTTLTGNSYRCGSPNETVWVFVAGVDLDEWMMMRAETSGNVILALHPLDHPERIPVISCVFQDGTLAICQHTESGRRVELKISRRDPRAAYP